MTDASPPDPLLGQTLSGRFKILEPLGAGGMGRVYKALQSPLERVVALKVLNPRYNASKDPGFERRFFLEASLTAKLHHPNTITVHDYGRTDDGIFYIAMEYVEGQTLAQLLHEQTTLTWQRVLHIAGQICRSLREAHKAGIIHRDLKPANVMVLHEETGSDLIKVLDFGLVKSFIPDGAPSADVPLSPDGPPVRVDTELTQAGVLLGSPLYMAPEQTKNQSDQRSDIYSLGILMFQCIAGKPPFTGTDSIDIIVKQVREMPPRLKVLAPEVPDIVDALVMRCIEKEPSARFQSMDEVLEALRGAAADTGMSGLFMNPRALTAGQMPALAPGATSKPRTASSSGLRAVEAASAAGPLKADMPSFVELTPLTEPPLTPSPRAWRFAGVGFGIGLLIVVIFFAMRSSQADKQGPVPIDEHPAPVAVVPAPPPVLKPVEPVSVLVSTVPEGAHAQYLGKDLGLTPVKLSLLPNERGVVSAELTFKLEGYEAVTVVAEGPGPEVTLIQTLQKSKTPPKKPKAQKPQNPTGYKEDPYQ
jgi:serine/threonine-protein kinase